MPALLGLLVGALIGQYVWPAWGAALGGLVGFFGGALLFADRQREAFRKPSGSAMPGPGNRAATDADVASIAALERRVAHLEAQLRDAGVAPLAGGGTAPLGAAGSQDPVMPWRHEAPAAGLAPEPPAPDVPIAPSTRAGSIPDTTERAASVASASHEAVADDSAPERRSGMSAAAAMVAADAPSPNPLWAWFTGGNAMTRIGVVALFFGVAFLLRYLAEHFTVPIALKLLAVAAIGIALITLGARLVGRRPAYGLALQGAGAGVLYLTAYAAFHPYALLGALPALALLAAIAALTVWLALAADAEALAVLAIIGAFLAPLLTGADRDPLPLFGYFALVNAMVLVLAGVRPWRGPALLGFLFTFGLGLVWGNAYYRPANFAVIEPFLIAFLAAYVAVVVLLARRGGSAIEQRLDAVLVFGVPFVAFALQAELVRNLHYGAAGSALVLAVGYGLLALVLGRRAASPTSTLARLFAVLALVFATLAVPFAVDNRVTAAVWAVEGALMFWLGVRQNAPAIRALALAIQIAAGVLFLAAGVIGDDDRLFLNAFFFGVALIAGAGFATAWLADRAGDTLRSVERALLPALLGWAALWWLAGGAAELVRQLSSAVVGHAVLAWVLLSVAVALAVARAVVWPRLVALAMALPPVMALVALRDIERVHTTLLQGGWLLWPAAWLVHVAALHEADRPPLGLGLGRASPSAPPPWLDGMHALTAVALALWLGWELSEWTGRITAPDTAWAACAAAVPAIAFLWLVTQWGGRAGWPLDRHRAAYAAGAGTPLAVLLTLWFLALNVLSPGESYPLPYVPLLNPLDVSLLAALVVVARWTARDARIDERRRIRGFGLGLFILLNGGILRAGHHWLDIPWDWPALFASRPLQAAFTLAWSVTAAVLMFAAGKHGSRPLWMVGAALLALVVAKLFLVDLAALEGLPRVVAFLGVGALLLLIGYLSPLPPAPRGPDGSNAG